MLPFSQSNNWSDFPELRCPLDWRRAPSNDDDILFVAEDGGLHFLIRLNDFPIEPLYTFFIDDVAIIHFDDWPSFWGAQPIDENSLT